MPSTLIPILCIIFVVFNYDKPFAVEEQGLGGVAHIDDTQRTFVRAGVFDSQCPDGAHGQNRLRRYS